LRFGSGPYPVFLFNADPDLDPASKINADPDPQHWTGLGDRGESLSVVLCSLAEVLEESWKVSEVKKKKYGEIRWSELQVKPPTLRFDWIPNLELKRC
jgi:hypothetical protein